jgi:proteasome lid subunit RPN8/RPN11
VELEISRAAFDAIVAHAREAAPRECCGLLIGLGAQIESAHRARNVDPSSTRFLIDPHDHFAAIRAARAGGREVVGVYHSHPSTPARPSATDLTEASDAECAYVIISLAVDPPEVRLFRLEAGAFVEEPLSRL